MNLIENLEARTGAMKVAELCELLGVDDKHIYRRRLVAHYQIFMWDERVDLIRRR